MTHQRYSNARPSAPLLLLNLLLTGLATATAEKCPEALTYGLPTELPGAAAAASFPGPPELFGLVASIQGGWVPALSLYETPISVRYTRLIDSLDWNCAAAYSDHWDDALTRVDPLVRAPSSVEVPSGIFGTQEIDLRASAPRFLCAVHAWRAVLTDWVPDAAGTLLPVLASLGLDFEDGMGYRDDVGECFADGTGDADCLRTLAEAECYSPAVMGQIVGRQLAEYALTDGKF